MTDKTMYENFRKMINECEHNLEKLSKEIDIYGEISLVRDLTKIEGFNYKITMRDFEQYEKMLKELNKAFTTYNRIYFERF